MTRVTFLFKSPVGGEKENPVSIDVWLPLLDALPRKERLEAAKVSERPMGEMRVAAVADVYFEDVDAMDGSMASRAGRALSRAIMERPLLAPEMLVCEVVELPA